ncbi:MULTISPECIES: sigma-70 family RNA polymerase sigma factor [Janibacter]|uniref:Sigma-70 family RNA polymerase sigma factor n=1 Tax=Janibacter melonis TaxID=262209 RepID=A0A5P8FRI0_9MICO|nr:sigma-70 family RNA polymerase sigma factor [Janibacter melonis]QFQ31432.1 sigma-70 family RNA polymerase sigma factor [Janibacter melonis]
MAVQLSEGQPSAIEAAYQHYSHLIYTIALRALGDRQDAEDVTQQVFLAAWRGAQNLRPSPTALPGWLVGIARHKIADVLQARGQESRRLRAVADETGRIGPAPARDHALEIAIIAELEAMGDPRGPILRMTIMEGLSHSDVADRLDLPLGTVKSHARRGLIHLRQVLKEVRDDD